MEILERRFARDELSNDEFEEIAARDEGCYERRHPVKTFFTFLAGLLIGTCLGYCIHDMVPMSHGATGHGRRTESGTDGEATVLHQHGVAGARDLVA